MHATCIELNNTLFVGETTEPDAVIARVVLTTDADMVSGFQGVYTILEHAIAFSDGLIACMPGHNEGLSGGRHRFNCIAY
jgi:hypothetical protein